MRLGLVLLLTFGALGCARRYAATGLVLRQSPGQVLVAHREIPGVMPAMTMPLKLRENVTLAPGDQLDFRLTPKTSSIDRVRRRAALGEGLTDGLALKPPPETIAPGALVPDFALTNHAGLAVTLASLRPNVVAINFIYTRCPLPEVCPRLTSHFARLQRRFAGRPVRLLTITLDPQYDTAPVLAEYARKWRSDGVTWQLLTGAKPEINLVAARFGMVYWPELGLLTHTSTTAVIDGTGRLAARVEGTSFEAAQLGDLLETVIEKK